MKAFILMLAIASGLGFAVRATLASHRNAAAIRALTSEHQELRERISHEQQRWRELHHASTATATAMTSSAQSKPSHEPGAPLNLTVTVPKLSATAIVANNPKLMAEYLREYRSQMSDAGNLGIFKAVGLSADQTRAMKDLSVEKEQRRMELVAAVETQGLDQQGEAYKALNEQNEQWWRKKQAEILGDLEPAYRDYECTQDVRLDTAVLAVAASHTGELVTASQLEQVTQILAANSERIQSGPKTGFVKEDTVNWNVALGQLKGVLTPSQIETLRICYPAFVEFCKLNDEAVRRQDLLTAQFKKQANAK